MCLSCRSDVSGFKEHFIVNVWRERSGKSITGVSFSNMESCVLAASIISSLNLIKVHLAQCVMNKGLIRVPQTRGLVDSYSPCQVYMIHCFRNALILMLFRLFLFSISSCLYISCCKITVCEFSASSWDCNALHKPSAVFSMSSMRTSRSFFELSDLLSVGFLYVFDIMFKVHLSRQGAYIGMEGSHLRFHVSSICEAQGGLRGALRVACWDDQNL